jgi:hypothetical protein
VDAAGGLDHTVEAAKSPTGPVPGTNDQHLMAVLTTALSSDPTARPTAAAFRDQLASLAVRETSDWGPVTTADKQPAPDQTAFDSTPRRQGKSRVAVLAIAAVLVTVIGSATVWLIKDPVSSGLPAATSQSAATPGGLPSSASPSGASEPTAPTPIATPDGGGDHTAASPAAEATIQLENSAVSAKPFEAVRISGTYHGGSDRFLRVQRREKGRWLSFPIPTRTDQSGKFMTYVELGQPGRYRLRVLDPNAGVESKPFVLVIKG